MDFLGWYTTGDHPDDGDIKIHKQICEINESPVLLKLNPQARHSDVSFMPITVCVVDQKNEAKCRMMVGIPAFYLEGAQFYSCSGDKHCQLIEFVCN
jgi:hypothetical protein